MDKLPIVKDFLGLSEALECEFNEKIKIGMSEDEVYDAVEEIINFPYDELEHVIKNIFTWGKPLEENSRMTLRNEYFEIIKRELKLVLESEILLEDYTL
jgi:hypothetical protein